MAPETHGAVALVIVGNEILSAKTRDENTSFLTLELRQLGVPVRRVLVVADEIDEIAWAVNAARRVARWVFTTGGVGPTHDDVTVAGVAAALGRRVVRHPDLERRIRAYLEVKGSADEIDSALKMAEVPEGAELLAAHDRSFPVPVVDGVYLFPGIPSVLKANWASIRERFRQQPYLLAEVFVTADEHRIAPALYRLQERYPELMLGSYPDLESREHRVKVTLESRDADYLGRALAALVADLPPHQVLRVVTAEGPCP